MSQGLEDSTKRATGFDGLIFHCTKACGARLDPETLEFVWIASLVFVLYCTLSEVEAVTQALEHKAKHEVCTLVCITQL
jgi:hypothetical protein